jgi:hypothetical protein
MKRALIIATVFLFSAHQLPAPISEVPEATPAPKLQPKREATPRPKPKPAATRRPTPNRSFAGTWRGTTVDTSSTGGQGSSRYVIKISDDEKTAQISWSYSAGDFGPYQTPCIRFGAALSWSLTGSETTVTDTFQLNNDGTAAFTRQGRWTSGDNQGVTFNGLGTFWREGASLAPSRPQGTTITSIPQTTAAAAPKNAGDLPTAKPVPNKPGFVYDPFDPNTKVILDCRGKASGTKLKDPFSGKLFTIP